MTTGDIYTGSINNQQTSEATGGQLDQKADAKFDFTGGMGGGMGGAGSGDGSGAGSIPSPEIPEIQTPEIPEMKFLLNLESIPNLLNNQGSFANGGL